ncbi:MAG TPA: hypothetical protein DCZ92_10765 [Elusimicrobia bacterium]|nr:MAG: hypothetical protein A2016_04455 [Elusimicrobia bacterium GWF2_62_30]HBA61276.1 hypothetical protein [Elusimicrobiota bacterium]
MGAYVYDGSFDGLICAVKAAAGDPAAEITRTSPPQEGLFSRAVEVEASQQESSAFLRQLDSLSDVETPEKMKLCFLWNGPEKESLLLAYARMAFSRGKELNNMLADPVVARVHKAAAAVLREAHRLKGFLRFSELQDRTLYAKMEPDHNVLPLIAGHFKRRMASSDWVIHDTARNLAALYFGGRLRVAELDKTQPPPFSDGEKEAVGLWRAFFNAVAIKERTNPRLQQGFVPLKYRSNMPEFDKD